MKTKAELRNDFAMAALAGGLEQGVEHDMAAAMPDMDNWWHSPEKIAERAYAIADAMLRRSLEIGVAEHVSKPDKVRRLEVEWLAESK